MNLEYDKILERQVRQMLTELPDLKAPASLAHSVMAAIAARRSLPWYQRAWQTWPMKLQVASMALLVGGFAAFCFAAWRLTQAAGYVETVRAVEEVISRFAAVWNVVTTLMWALMLVIKQLGTPYMIACALAAAIGYLLCLALGTLWVRLATQQH